MENKKILIATAFPTQGAGSGALVTTQAKSYVEDGEQVVIITGNNRTNFDKLDGVRYHLVPFTAEVENPEKIDGQLPFNYLMFTTHTESTANFWKVNLENLEKYCEAYKKALEDEVKNFNPDVIHAQHNWLLSSAATEVGKPVVTTIHGTDLMGYERSKIELENAKNKLAEMKKKAEDGKFSLSISEISRIEEAYMRSSSVSEIRTNVKRVLSEIENPDKADIMQVIDVLDSKRKYEFFMHESEKSAKNSDKIIVISEAQREKFTSLFPFASDKVVLLENGYDPKTFFVDKEANKNIISTLTSNQTSDGKIDLDFTNLILFVGKFADFKGIDSLLSAAKIYETELAKQGKKPLTLIVGSGALGEKLEKQLEQLGLKNTHFVGRQGHEVIRKLQNLSDVSLIPSRDEPFGLVVIEGTACGHPVIGSNSGGIPGILNTTKEKLPNENIIATKLGMLVKPLPVRPEVLSEDEKDELDVITTDYVMANEEDKKKIIENAKSKFNVGDEIKEYFDEYEKSTRALADATMKIVNKEVEFDNEEIAEYTKNNYSQSIIRDKLIGIFDDAEREYAKKNNSRIGYGK